MTAPVQSKAGGLDSSFMEGTEAAGAPDRSLDIELRRAERMRLLVQPVVAVLLGGGVLVWALGVRTLT
ncbi:MAG: hypothetical protein ACXVGR_15265, partial [Mycobacteriaceae bacterium]